MHRLHTLHTSGPLVAFSAMAGAVVVLLAFSVLVWPAFSPGRADTPTDPAVGTVIRIPAHRADRIVEAAKNDTGLEVERQLTLHGGDKLVTLSEPNQAMVTLALGSGAGAPLSLMEAESLDTFPNYVYHPPKTPNDPTYQDGDQWNMDITDAPKAWNITTGSSNTVIAIVDSGVLFHQAPYEDHLDMKDHQRWENSDETHDSSDDDDNGYDGDKYGWDFVGGYAGDNNCPNDKPVSEDNDPQPYSCDDEDNKGLLNKNDPAASYIGHGTIVGSIAAAKTNNELLVAGADWNTKIMNLRVFDGYGVATTAQVVSAIKYATAEGADAINLSLALYNSAGSCDITDTETENALKDARDKGIITAAASGNGNKDHVCYPASSKHTIAVGASNKDDQRARFSNYGNTLDLIAPGKNVPALSAPSKANSDSEAITGSGTSLSTPHITGAAALLKAKFPDTDLLDVRANLRETAANVAQMNGRDVTTKHGDGRLNLHNSLQIANLEHPDGTLVQRPGKDKVFRVNNEGTEKRRLGARPFFESRGYTFADVRSSTPTDVDLSTGSSINFREGTLVQGDGDAIYVINYDSNDNREKRHITSRGVFDALGYELEDVMDVNQKLLPSQNGDKINSADRHPDGTLVQASGENTVYWLEDGQRRRVVSRSAFVSHGFLWDNIREATSDDLNLSRGSGLSFREGTLVQGDSDAIYVINYDSNDEIEKRHITSRLVFQGLGYTFDNVLDIPDGQIPSQNGDKIP